MKSLPADPARLRAYLRTHIPAGVIHAPKGQPQVPENIRLVATVVDLAANQAIPPALRVGLFRVLETMPGLSVERDVVDGIGRHGIAVVMSAVDAGVQLARVQIVFDRKSYAYLGMRTILTADDKTRGIPAGVVSSVTVVRTAIVDGAPTGHNVAREPC